MSDPRLSVDNEVCSGHGRCYSMHPDLFAADDSGYPVVLVSVFGPDDIDDVDDAVGNCPEGAIRLDRDADRIPYITD